VLGLGCVLGLGLGLDCSNSKKVESNAKSQKLCGISENASGGKWKTWQRCV